MNGVWYSGHSDGSVVVIQGMSEEPLPHHVKHSHASWRFNPLGGVKFDVAIRAQELEVLRMPPDFDGVGLKPAGAPTPEGVVPLLLISGVDVMEVQGGRASVVAATLALAPEELDQLRTLSTLSLPQAFLVAWPADSYVPLGPGVGEGLAAIGAESGWFEVDASTLMGAIGAKALTTRLTTPLLATGSAEVSGAISAVGNAIAATFTIQRWVGFHTSMVQAQEEGPFSWGYNGSGPAELARCILIHALGERAKCTVCDGSGRVTYGPSDQALPATDYDEHSRNEVVNCWECEEGIAVLPTTYQQFKFEVVARFTQGQPWSMPRDQVLAWYAQNRQRVGS